METQINNHLEDLPLQPQYKRSQQVNEKNENLVKLEQKYNVFMVQINGQRILKHADNSVPAPTEDNCEIFIGKLPRDILEDELYPLFAKVGKVYESRLMMDFSGSNRGFCFVKYSNPTEARNAVQYLNKYEIKPGCFIGAVKSVNNCRLVISHLPFDIDSESIIKEIFAVAKELKTVSIYQGITHQYRFAIITYKTHRDAAMARREFVPRKMDLFKQGVSIDWAEPNFKPNNVV